MTDAAGHAYLERTEDRLGTEAMLLFILTEGMLFLMFFFAYAFLARTNDRWPLDAPPKLVFALVMLAVLLSSSAVLHWGERQVNQGRHGAARAAVAVTIGLGVVFLVLQLFEYREHLKRLTPWTDAYGSLFYTITTFHAAHVTLGLLMLGYVLALPRLEPAPLPPHRPLHNASLYWHFVDGVWLVIVGVLYVLPNLTT